MTSIMDSGTSLENGRNRRIPSLDHMNPIRPSMTFGSSFGVGQSPWTTNGSIWRPTPIFTDGIAAEQSVSDSRSRANHNETYPSGKTGSSSLLPSSESEGRSGRSNVPWDVAAAPSQSIISRPQTDFTSPIRKKTADNSSNGQCTTSQNSYRSMPPTGNSQTTDYPGHVTNQHVGHRGLTNKSHAIFERQEFPEFQPNFSYVQRNEQVNHSNFGTNGTISAQQNRRLGEAAGDDRTAQLYTNGNVRNGGSAINGSYESHASSAEAVLNSRFNLVQQDHVTHTPNTSQFQPLNGMDIQDESELQPETHLPLGFGHTSLENGRSQWNTASLGKPQYQQLRSPYEANLPNGKELGKARPGYSVDDRSNVGNSQATFDVTQDFGYQYLPNYYRVSSFGDQTTSSPTASEYRRSLQSPYYSTTGTPPTGPESMQSASGSGLSSRASNGHSAMLERKLRNLEPYGFDQNHLQPNPLQPHLHYPPLSYDLSNYASTMRMNPLANPYTMSSYLNTGGAPPTPRYPSREHDISQIIRSPLLEEFRTNSKTNKRYELRDIYNHVVEFSGDQHGSRFIQQKLETANSDEKDQIFTEILPDSLQLMTDVFGNYVIQKLFEHGNQSQKKLLANGMKGHVFTLSLQMYGCRVVQKALEHILTDQQASMVKELESHVLKCVKDQNGNHVIQKAIERVPAEHIQFIVEAFHEQVQRLATHPYGCRVIQRMLEHCQRPAKQAILHEMHECVPTLITDQFGNYVIQHVIERGDPEDKYRVVSIVQAQLLIYSKHKFASNVVEKSIEFSEESQRKEILHQLTVTNERGESPVFGLMRDQYGNYVIQKVLGQLQGVRRQALVDQIKGLLPNLKKYSYGKQIAAIEKLILEYDNPSLSLGNHAATLPHSPNGVISSAIAASRKISSPTQASLANASGSASTSTGGGRTNSPSHASKPLQPHDTQIAVPLPPRQPRV